MKIKDAIGPNLPLINRINALAFFGLSITTLYTANVTALAKLQPALGVYAWLAPFAALIVAFAIGSFFDMNLRKNIISSLQAVWADDWREAKTGLKAVAIFFVLVAVVRLSLSTGATFISGSFMADDMVKEVDTEGLENMQAEKLQTKQSIISGLSTQIREVQTNAREEADRIVNAAIDAGGAKWAAHWRAGNEWYRTISDAKYANVIRWRKSIYDAEKKADRIIAAANEEARELRKQSTAMIQAETNDPTFAAIASAKIAKVAKAQRRESLLRIGLWTLDGLFTFMAILTSIGLVIGVKECRPDFNIFREEETTFWQVTQEAVASAWRIVVSYGVALVAGLDAKAAQVAGALSNGTGAIDLNARAVEMRRGAHIPATHATSGAPVASEPATPAPRPATEKKAPAPDSAPDVPSARGGAVSDKRDAPAQVDVKYVDMKNHIDRIAKRYKRAWKANDTEKMRHIVADKKDGVAWLESLGFEVTCDEKTGRISVKKN